MSNSTIFIDTLFCYPTALTATGVTTTCLVADQDDFAPINYGFQVTVASIGTSIVVRFEGSLDGVTYFNLDQNNVDTTITANSTTGYCLSGCPVNYARLRLVSFSGGSPSVATLMCAG
jgi:hypothetical protein